MKNEILAHSSQPGALEKLYRSNRTLFKREFNAVYPQLKGDLLADFWNERLNFEDEQRHLGSSRELLFVIIASLLAGVIAKLPAFFPIDEDFFYLRNIGFIVFPPLMAYFAWKHHLSINKIGFLIGAGLAALVFINLLPSKESDITILSCVHLLLFLWSLLGFAFVGTKHNDVERRLGYLRFNGDLVVITTLILIAGAILSGITIALFSLIGFNIEKFYFEYVVVFGLAAAPIVGTFLTRSNPQLVGKVSPVIAKMFCPLVLVTLIIFLFAIIYSGKDPYNDREFLLLFNGLLVGVMAIIFFSIAETSSSTQNVPEIWLLLLLSLVTVILNCIALSAILFRISEWGITPNRTAVLGGNVLILINLVLVAWQLIKLIFHKDKPSGIGNVISIYLPIYFVWTIIVTFIFPFVFGFQ